MPKQNILLITSDQHHWAAWGSMNPEVKTPNLDRLAREGVTFTRAYTVNPTCTPTRASIITGKYPSQHGAWSLGTKLPESEPTLGDTLRPAGYKSALIGKAHFQQLLDHPLYPSIESNPHQQNLAWWKSFTGPFYGFDYVQLCRNHADEYHVGQHYASWMEEKGFAGWRSCFQKPAGTADRQQGAWNLPEEFHYDAWISETTNRKLEEYREKNEPFFLWASFPDPHPPYLVPEPWASMYDPAKLTVPEITPGEHAANPPHFGLTQESQPDFSAWREKDGNAMHGFHSHVKSRDQRARELAIYYGMISMMDHHIGKILDKLDSLGLASETAVVFTTDHGHFLGQHGLTAKGAFLYEDLVKVPFLVRLPGAAGAGTTCGAMQSLVDLAPTFLGLAGVEIPRTMAGVDQGAVWRGEKAQARDHVIVENRHQPTTLHQRCFINERYKITVYYNRSYGELFDLRDDPGETRNLWNEPGAQALKSDLLLAFIHAELGKEPLWMPRVCGA